MFGKQISKWRRLKTMAIFDFFFTYFIHQEKDTRIHQHMNDLPKYTMFLAHTFYFFALPILRKLRIS